MLASLTSTYPSYKSLKDVKLPLYLENALEKRYSQKTFFKSRSRGMWKIVYPRLLAVNVPYRRKFPFQRVRWFVHSVFQHKS